MNTTMDSLSRKAEVLENFISTYYEDLGIYKKLYHKYFNKRKNGENVDEKLYYYMQEIKECKKAINEMYHKLQNIYMYMDAEQDIIDDAELSFQEYKNEVHYGL